MFGRLIRRDLADLNAVHSGQFVSNFLYDATLMRDALTQGVAADRAGAGAAGDLCRLCAGQRLAIGRWPLLALPGVAWAMERLGGSMRRAATRGMQETGDLSVVLSEAMDGRRVIKAYGLEAHSVDAGASAAGGAAEDPAESGAAARRRRAHDRHFRRAGDRRGAVLSPAGRICMASSPSTHFAAFIDGAAAGAAAGAQSQPALAHRLGRASPPPAACSRRSTPGRASSSRAGRENAQSGSRGGAVRFRDVSFAYHGDADPALEER